MWYSFFFPSSAFAMHCDNRPDADYGVQKVSSAMVSAWGKSPAQRSFDLLGFLCRLSNLTTGRGFLFHTFDHSHCHGLTHVTHRKPPWQGMMVKHLLSLVTSWLQPIIEVKVTVNVWFNSKSPWVNVTNKLLVAAWPTNRNSFALQ